MLLLFYAGQTEDDHSTPLALLLLLPEVLWFAQVGGVSRGKRSGKERGGKGGKGEREWERVKGGVRKGEEGRGVGIKRGGRWRRTDDKSAFTFLAWLTSVCSIGLAFLTLSWDFSSGLRRLGV